MKIRPPTLWLGLALLAACSGGGQGAGSDAGNGSDAPLFDAASSGDAGSHGAGRDQAGSKGRGVDGKKADADRDASPSPQTDVPDGTAVRGCEQDSDCPASDEPCARIRCGPAGLCVWVQLPDQATCDDGDPCTLGEHCKQHACVEGAQSCGCQQDADCGPLEDGDACKGTLYCDKTSDPPACRLNPGSVVTCETATAPCTARACDPKTGQCVQGPAPAGSPCDDGDPCTASDSCAVGENGNGVCTGGTAVCECWTVADCLAKEDGDACNGTLYCDNTAFPHRCRVNPTTVVHCDAKDDTACLRNTCDPKTGSCALAPAPDKTACEDGNTCTKGDHCSGGQCAAGTDICTCKSQADCAAKEDGDPCNGTLYCDFSLAAPACRVNPATVVRCPTAKDNACRRSRCNGKTGRCALTAIHHLGACEDGNPCTTGDHCTAGKCFSGPNACQCKQDSDCAGHEDGDLCNGTLFCDKSKVPFVCGVNPATVVRCRTSEDTECLANRCQPASGHCLPTVIGDQLTCDADGNPCTKSDRCDKGACVAGPNVCPCEQTADCGKYEDGDVCNGLLYCNKAGKAAGLPVCEVNPASVVICPDGDDTACLEQRCNRQSGTCVAVVVNQGAPCNADNNKCTADDACDAGKCVVGTNTCACTSDADCGGKDDGNLCNGTLFCDKTALPFVCRVNPATVVHCPADSDATDCLEPRCAPLSGSCTPTRREEFAACDDGQECTFGDRCVKGMCTSGKNLCACQRDEECAVYDDGDACNGVFFCDRSEAPYACRPKGHSAVTCPTPHSPCAYSSCRKTDGRCLVAPIAALSGKPCDDGDPCTTGTTCAGLFCKAGEPVDCDDHKVCTDDSCRSKPGPGGAPIGCLHLPVKVTCDDGDVCTGVDRCGEGAKCLPGPPIDCDDGNACTADACEKGAGEGKGCRHAPRSGACEDGEVCSVGDACKLGTCAAGKARDCEDGNACTAASCTPGSGADAGCKQSPRAASCDDGNPCTGGDRCKGGVCRAGDQLGCDDGNACTDDRCDPGATGAKACQHTLNTAPCTDGKACTAGGNCQGGACVLLGFQAPYQGLLRHKLWDYFYGGSGRDELRGLALMPDLSIIAAGVRGSGALGPADGWVLRIDRSRKQLWSRKTGQAGDDGFDAVVRLGDGVVAVGWTAAKATGRDLVAQRVGAGGQLGWRRSWPLAGDDSGYGVVGDKTGGVVAVGSGGGRPAAIGLRAKDTVSWQRRYGSQAGLLRAVVARSSGGFAAAGEATVAHRGVQCRLVLLDAGGKLEKTADFGGADTERCHGLSIYAGGYVLVGQGPWGTGKTRIMAIHTDSAGGLKWWRRWTLRPPSVAFAVAPTAGGGLLIGGRGWLNSEDLRLLQLGAGGHLQWERNYGPGGFEEARGVAVLPDGGLWVVGTTSSKGHGGRDGWVLRLDPWGHDSCYDAGGCADTLAGACLDGEICTRDRCDKEKGCVHPELPTLTPCGDGGVCGQGVCKLLP